MDLIERLEKPTPKFFRLIRNLGIGSTALAGTILSAPAVLPAAVTTIAGYLLVAGTVASIVSQAVIQDQDDEGGKI